MRDTDARLKIYLAHRPALVDYATPILGSRSYAEDVVQEAYLRFVHADIPMAGLRVPAGYLYRIVRNLAVDMGRRLSADARRDKAYADTFFPAVLASSPEEELACKDDLLCVSKVLKELPPEKRTAFEMHRLGGLTFEQIARHLGVAPATAHRMVQDVLVQLMRRLDDAGG